MRFATDNRPWYRLRLTTVIAIAIVAAVLFDCQIESFRGPLFGTNLLATHEFTTHGWPADCVTRWVTWTVGPGSPYSRTNVGIKWQWDAPALLLDIATSIVLLVSVAFVFERWFRWGNRKWQFSVRSMLTLTVVAAVIAMLLQIDSPATWPWSFADPQWIAAIVGRSGHLYLGIPILFAVGCTVALATTLAGSTAKALWRWAVSRGDGIPSEKCLVLD